MYGVAEVLHMWLVSIRIDEMQHHGMKKGPLVHERAFMAIDHAKYAIEEGHW